MEPLEFEVRFGIDFSKVEPGTIGLGIAYVDSKQYWKGQSKIWGEEYTDDQPTKMLIITFIIFVLQIGTMKKEKREVVTMESKIKEINKWVEELGQEVVDLLRIEQMVIWLNRRLNKCMNIIKKK